MSFIKRQSIHQRKIGDKTFILTADGNMEMNLAEGKEFKVNANMTTTGDVTGPKVTNVYYVTEDGSDLNDGRSADKNGAFASIKRASEVAPVGSTIILAPGDYYENNPITLRDFVTVTGQGELRNTRVFPKNPTSDIFLMGNACYLYQITFRGLRAPGWCARIRPGALVTTSPYVQNCTNMNGPWLNDGTEFVPFETVQIPGITPSARPILLADNPSLPVEKQVNINGGGGGLLVDGDDYDPASLVFSFVADAFTQISQGGIGFHVTNFGYTQIVSCFSVFCSTGFLTTKGGYLSISNSVSDFGTNGVVADGYYPIAYTSAKVEQNYYSTVASVTLSFPGTGYDSNPTVTFSDPEKIGGTTATATAAFDPTTGEIAAVTIVDAGTGYTSLPTVTFTGGGASVQATATVNLRTNASIQLSSLRDKPQTGSVIKLSGDDTFYYITSNTIIDQPFVYNQETCERDVRRIVDAVTGDIVMGTYYQTTTAATSYLRSTSTKVILDQLAPTIYALESTRDEMKALTTNLAMKEEIDQRFNIITNTLNAGDSSGIPFIGENVLSSFNDLSSIDNELIEAKDNVLANRDFIVEELNAYINDQFTEMSYNTAEYTEDMTVFLTGLSYYIGHGGDETIIRQAKEFRLRPRFKSLYVSSFEYARTLVLGYSEISSDGTSVTRVNEAFNMLINVVDDGDSSAIVPTYAEGNGPSQNQIDVKDQLIANKDFLVAEFNAFLAQADGTLTYDVAAWEVYAQNVIDGLIYDLLYGGNSASRQEALFIWRSVTWTKFTTTNQQAFEDTFARLRFAAQRVIRGLSVVATSGNTETQDFTSGNATQVEATLLDGLVQIVEGVIDAQSIANIVAAAYPNIEDEPAGQVNAAAILLVNAAAINTSVLSYNLTNNADLTYNEEKCKRDVGYIVDAVYRDAQLGTNQNSITAALSYKRANTAYLNVQQKPATIIALREAKRLTVAAANGEAAFQAKVDDLFDNIFDIIEFDQLPSEGIEYPEPGPAAEALIDAHAQFVANKNFLVGEVIAYIADNNFVYDQAKCERDTGIIISGAGRDALLGTNYNSVTNGLSYLRVNAGAVLSDQLTETLAAITFAKGQSNTATASDATAQTDVDAAFDEVIDIVTNGIGNADALVWTDPSDATAGRIAAKNQMQANRAFLQAEAVAFITNNYKDFTYDQAKCERDIGLILDAVALDVALGTNYNSVTAGLAYQRASSAELQDNQLIQTAGALRELKKQIVKLGLSDTAEPLAEAAMDEIIDILENGALSTDNAADTLVFATPGTLPSVNCVEAKDQLIANKAFIQEEIIRWLAVNYPALSYDSTKCSRDVGYIIDALCHDIMYGGNSATQLAAQSYFVGAASQLGAGQQTATAAAYNRLGQVVSDVVIEATVVPSGGGALSQDTSGTPASSTEADDVAGLVQVIEDVIIADSIAGLPAVVLPSVVWATPELQQAYSTLKGNKASVQEAVIIFIANNYQSFTYDEAKCQRDVGIMIEAVCYDATIGTNYNQVTAGLAYQRANAAVAIGAQNLQTVKAIEYLRDTINTNEVQLSGLFRSRVLAGFNEILDIINNGSVSTDDAADVITFPNSGLNANYPLAVTQLQANRNFLAAETSAYVVNNFPSVVFNAAKCQRDVKYIVDALCYDIIYRGNLASKNAAEAYFVGAASQLGAGQQAATAAAFADLANVISDVIQGISHASTEQAVVSQDTANPGADAGTAGEAEDLLQIVEDVVTAGDIDGIPADNNTDITWTAATLQLDFADLNSTTKVEFYKADVIDFINRTFTRSFTFNSAKCSRDTGYIVDALTYDILYGGNSATYQAAQAYYVGYVSQVVGQQPETAAALGWVNTLLGSVLLDNVYGDPEQAVETQDTSSAAATATEVTKAQTLLQTFQDVITDGVDNLPAVSYPTTTWATSGAQTAIASLEAAKATIVADTITELENNYNAFSYDVAKCTTDTGSIIDAVAYDLLYTGNIQTIIATNAYFLGAAQYIPASQVANTVAAYTHLQDIALKCIEGVTVTPTTGNTETQVLAGSYGTSVESSTAVGLIGTIKNAINTGSLIGVPGEVNPDFSWLPATTRSAANALLAQKTNIQNGVITYIQDSILGFEYDVGKCARDTGYVVDAVIYDAMYGGNKQSRRAAEAYYSGAILNATAVGGTDQTAITAYSYYKLGSLLKEIAENTAVTKSYNNTATQTITIPDADTTRGDLLKLLVDRIALSVLQGYTTGWSEVNHNYELGSSIYNTERNTIVGATETIVDNAIADLNEQYGGSATVTVFPGITSALTTQDIALYNVSTISTSGHAFEYVGAGVTYNALPFFGGTAVAENEIQELNNGKVFAGGTVDQIGNFRVGNFFGVNALTGSITLNANEIDLKGLTSVGPFIRDGIPVGVELKEVSDNANLISTIGTQDINTAPTQKAVSTYVENRYLNKLTGGTVIGNLVLNGDFDVNGDVISTDVTGSFNLLNTSATTINAFGEATSINIGAATGTVTINPDMLVQGSLTVNGDIVFTGDVSLNIPDESQQAYSISTEGSLDFISINTRTDEELVTFGIRPSLLVENTTESTSVTSGALVIDGGVGIAKSVNIGIDLTVDGSVILGDDRAVDTIDINGTTDIDVPDNSVDVFRIHENVTDYITINTTDTAEVVEFGSVPNIIVLNNDDATDDTTGAVQITGGLSTQRNIHSGVDITADRDIVADRDIQVNGTNITTDETGTFNVFNTNATRIDAFGTATTINIGAASGILTINNEIVIIDSVTSLQIPVGDTAERPTEATGQVRFNTDTTVFEGYDGNVWGSLGGVKDVDQNTFIRPETSPGANNDELEFFTNGTQRAIIGNTFFNVDSSVITTFANTTVSSNFGNGAVVIAGGLGVAKDINVQGAIGGNNSGVLQLTKLATDTIDIRANTVLAQDGLKLIMNAPDSSADDIVYPMTFAHHSSAGTPVAGSGTGVRFEMETANNNFEIAGDIALVATDITGLQEDFDMVFSTMISGTAGIEKLRLSEDVSTLTTDLAINNDTLSTNQTTFNLLNTTATTVNFAGDATTISIGAATGTLTVNHNFHVTGTVSLDNDLAVAHGGTGVSTFTTDGILYGNAATDVQVTDAAGTSDASDSFQILTVTSAVDATPVWTDTIDGGTF